MWLFFDSFISDIHAAPTTNDEENKGPVFVKEPINRIDFSNSTGAVVECRASGNPAPELIWVRSDGTAVGDVPGLRQVLSNGNLVFPPFQAEDYRQEVHAQVYACLAKNQFGSVISRDVNVRAGKEMVSYFQTFKFDLMPVFYSAKTFWCTLFIRSKFRFVDLVCIAAFEISFLSICICCINCAKYGHLDVLWLWLLFIKSPFFVFFLSHSIRFRQLCRGLP